MRLADWLLSLALRRDSEREMVIGDLREQQRRRGGLWYWCQAINISAHAVIRPFRASGEPRRRGDFFMRIFFKDVKYAGRSLAKRPLLTATVALTLALGLGANAAIFNLIDRLVLRPFPFADPDRVVMLAETGRGLDFRKESVSPANFLDWRAQSKTLTSLAAMDWWDANLLERNDPERVQGYQVSWSYFEALGVRPALGRGFVKDDETFGQHHVVVLSDALWKRRFDGDPAMVGRSITIDGQPYQVIGIAPERFAFPDGAALWAPLAFDPQTAPRRDSRYLTVVGRLTPGHSFEDASAEMNVLAVQLAQQYPAANRDRGVRVYTLAQGMLDEGMGSILSLWQSSAFVVLLIACANIASLLLARATERRRDVAVRLALGASRWRVIREQLTESVLLAGLAIPGALLFAWMGLYLMRMAMPANIIRFVPGWESLGPDFRLLAFTVVLAIATVGIFGVLPAFQASATAVSESLKEGGRTATGRQVLRRAIVIAEIAIALPLLVCAGLGVLGTNRFLNGPQGYDPDGLLTMRLVLPPRTYPDEATRRQFVERALSSVAAVPGVEGVAAANNMPASGGNSSRSIEIDGHPAPDPKDLPRVDNRVITPSYFAVMKIPIVSGRAFSDADRADGALVAVVSQSLADKHWPGEDPVGRRLRIANGPWLTVVGISGDIIQDWFARRNSPTLYRPIAQAPSDYLGIAVRTSGDPAGLAGGVRAALLRTDPNQPVFDMMTMRRLLHERTIGLQYLSAIMTIFSALALLLAAVGLYAVIAYFVAQRRHEIGLRMALGATRGDVVRLTVFQGMRMTVVGTVIGLALSVALARLMEAGLLGVATTDARVFAAFALLLLAVALLAGYLPARRAARIDPMVALRAE